VTVFFLSPILYVVRSSPYSDWILSVNTKDKNEEEEEEENACSINTKHTKHTSAAARPLSLAV
jgi:hypothetical protein